MKEDNGNNYALIIQNIQNDIVIYLEHTEPHSLEVLVRCGKVFEEVVRWTIVSVKVGPKI